MYDSAPIFYFADFTCVVPCSLRASRLVLLPISCPSHVRWCSLVHFPCYFLLSDISPSSYTCCRAVRGTENPYYMFAYLYIAYLAHIFGPARLATLAVLHIFWTSCRCSIYFTLIFASRAAFLESLSSATGVIYNSIKAFSVALRASYLSFPFAHASASCTPHFPLLHLCICVLRSAFHHASHDCHSTSY
jgi:hypothetical protein